MLVESNTPTLVLNQGQKEAAEGFQQFLFGPEKELILSGPAGTGKTFLMKYMIDHVMDEYHRTCAMMGIPPEYDSVVMAATTNKAAEVLATTTGLPTETIHSFLRLKVIEDFTTGTSKLQKREDWIVHQRLIIFIDEAFMVDSPLLEIIRQGTHKCKIVYVGDHCQLAPVMETISPIQRLEAPFYELTKLVRNADQPALMALSQQLRETVETGVFKPIQMVPGVIDLANDEEMEEAIEHVFRKQTREARILAYTNKRVQEYNEHIRVMRNLPDEFGPGELLVNTHAMRLGKRMLSVEEEVEIVSQQEDTEQMNTGLHDGQPVMLEVRKATLKSRLGHFYTGVPLPVDRKHYADVLKWWQSQKAWHRYFGLKNAVPDLRARDAATVHKAQGSTHDVVFIDLEDISRCHQPQMAARLLYVAFTRARSRVIVYGQLAQKYGGLVE